MPISPKIAAILSAGGGDKDPLSGVGTKQSPQLQRLQMRDIVHSLVAKGVTNASNPDDRANLQYITMIKGEPFARKLFNQISLFNQRDDVKNSKNPEDRINKYYTLGSSDKDVQSLIDDFKGLGGKPVTTDSPMRANIDMGMGVISPPVKGILNSGSQ